jgi:hypothetical protein
MPIRQRSTLGLTCYTITTTRSERFGALISVEESFQWTGGFIADGGTVRVQGQGSVSTNPPGSLRRGPSLENDCTLDVTGTLTITGPGSLPIGGGYCRILNSGSIILAQGGLLMTNATVVNKGTITVAGKAAVNGGEITNLGIVTIPAGSELVLGGNAVLHLAGGRVTGGGILHPADDGSYPGTVSVEADTVLPAELTLNLSGIGYVSTPTPTPVSPQPLLHINGKLGLNGGTLYLVHVSISPAARCTISGTASSVYGGQLDNLGVITVLPGTVWELNSGAQVNNVGRLSLQGDSAISVGAGGGTVTNIGLIESRGTVPNQIIGIPVSSTGNVAVREGILSLISGTVLTITCRSPLSRRPPSSSTWAGASTNIVRDCANCSTAIGRARRVTRLQWQKPGTLRSKG